jgi:hypothetical protein
MKKIILCIIFLQSVLLGYARSEEMVGYKIKLRTDQGSDIGRCGVSLSIQNVGQIDLMASAPNYELYFNIPQKINANHLVKIKGKKFWGIPPNNAPACVVDGEIYINQLILDEWAPIKAKYRDSQILGCMDMGAKKYNESIDGSASNDKLYIRVDDKRSVRIIKTCERLLEVPLKTNLPCDLSGDQGKSICREEYYNPKNRDKWLSLEEALNAMLDGEEIRKGTWETSEGREARKERKKKEDERRQAEQEERDKLAKQREERERWLQTAEGKKYLAEEEAKRRKSEEERRRAEVAENARMAAEFPYVAKLTCTIYGNNTALAVCFGGRVDTEIELKNGTQYGLYKFYQFNEIGNETNEGMTINLRKNFSIKAQNSHDKFILGIKIYDRKTNNIIYEKQVSQFGVISVGNK